MTRLDVFILRMQAQRACVDEVARLGLADGAPVLELGLGNGRTYDHLRDRFEGHPIFVFDRQVAAHPDCIPAGSHLRLGDFRQTIPVFLAAHRGEVGFIHADVGSANKAKSIALANVLAPSLSDLLVAGGYLACDQPIQLEDLVRIAIPGGDYCGCYHFYRRAG
ncbi:MAG: class I SAM-dependent methyltransferase [Rhodoferax sp.]|nr:class I SAM-dependent methyltransferase [Rhodoferax sp.]